MRTFRGRYFLLFLFSLVFQASAADEGPGGDDSGWTSGGGDPLRFYFTEGREVALEALDNLRLTDVPVSTRSDVREFLSAHAAALRSDVSASPFSFTVNAQPTCGLTKFERNSVISFSTENCRAIGSKEEAAKLIVHEAIHHFGYKEEAFADAVAIAVFGAWESLKIKEVPLCKSNEQSEILSRLSGSWRPDVALTKKLGGRWQNSPRGELSFEVRNEFLREFKGIGKCALQSGILSIKIPNGPGLVRSPYVIVNDQGSLALVIKKQQGLQPGAPIGRRPPAAPRPPRRRQPLPVRNDNGVFYLTLTKATETRDDLLFLGDENTDEASSAFQRAL